MRAPAVCSRPSRLVPVVVLVAALAPAARAADSPGVPAAPAPVRSMGQPPLWKPYVAGSFTWNREDDRTGGLGVLGIHKDLMNPMIGALGLSGEGYVGGTGGGWDGGARLFLTSRLLFLNIGVDYNARDQEADFILAFTPYFRRGGLFGTGGNFRIEWIPGRNNSFNFGFQLPLEPHMGRTRAVATRAPLPKPPAPPPAPTLSPEASEALATLRYEALWLFSHADVFNDDDAETYDEAMAQFRVDLDDAHDAFRRTDARHPAGHSYAAEKRHYDEAFDQAFAAAVGEAAGSQASNHAREALLDDVLLPYNRLVGRYKDPDDLRGLGAKARIRLAAALDAGDGLDEAQRAAALAVFDNVSKSRPRSGCA